MSKIVIIGANHASIAAANTLLDNYEDNEVIIIEKGKNISYLGAGTALWVGQQIDSTEGLFYTSPEDLAAKGADIRMNTTVTKIDFEEKTIYMDDTKETYDKLILATGSQVAHLNVKGEELENVHYLKHFEDAVSVNAAMDDPAVETVAVVGAGYIGVEMAEAVRRRNKKVLLFDIEETSLTFYYDNYFAKDMDKILEDHGIETHYSENVLSFEGKEKIQFIKTDMGRYKVDLVLNGIGFEPNTKLGGNDIELYENGAYLVNEKQETSIKDVYAIGDCAAIYSNALQNYTYIALATNAVRSGIIAAHNCVGTDLPAIGVQGSNGISIYGYNMVSTGVTVRAAERAGLEVGYTDYEDMQKAGFMKKTNSSVKIRIVYEKSTRRIVGAQLASYEDVSMAIHVFSLAIQEQVTIDKFQLLDIFYLPHFNQPYNYITMAALSAK